MRYNPYNLKDFETEWGIHKGSKEWWYATAVVFDEDRCFLQAQNAESHLQKDDPLS